MIKEAVLERELRDIAYVPRWAIKRVRRQQFLPEHMYFVAVYSNRILDMLHHNSCLDHWSYDVDRGDLLEACLYHDIDEIITGDIPRPAKVAMKKMMSDGGASYNEWLFKQASKRFFWWKDIKDDKINFITGCADLLEALLFVVEEQQLGNRNLSSLLEYMKDQYINFVNSIEFLDYEDKSLMLQLMMNSILDQRKDSLLVIS